MKPHVNACGSSLLPRIQCLGHITNVPAANIACGHLVSNAVTSTTIYVLYMYIFNIPSNERRHTHILIYVYNHQFTSFYGNAYVGRKERKEILSGQFDGDCCDGDCCDGDATSPKAI